MIAFRILKLSILDILEGGLFFFLFCMCMISSGLHLGLSCLTFLTRGTKKSIKITSFYSYNFTDYVVNDDRRP